MRKLCLTAISGLLITALILALCAVADAGGHCVVRNRVVVQHQAAAVVVQPVVAAVFTPVVVPAYSVGYSGHSDLQGENERLKLEIKLQRLELQIQKLQSAPQPDVPVPQQLQKQAVGEHPAIAILRKNCATCHDASVAKGKGGGFALTDGQAFAKLTDRQSLGIIREIWSSRMPKGGKLTNDEVGIIVDWIDSQK